MARLSNHGVPQSPNKLQHLKRKGPLSTCTSTNIQNLEKSLSSFTHKLQADAQNLRILVNQSNHPLKSSELEHHHSISTKFLKQQQQRLNRVELDLLSLTDIALGRQDPSKGEELPSTKDIADACQFLHTRSAKELIYLEEIMSGYPGFIGPSIQTSNNKEYFTEHGFDDAEEEEDTTLRGFEEAYDDSDETGEGITDRRGRFSFTSSIVEEESIVNEIVGQPLNRWSEVDAETDGGTPGSLFTIKSIQEKSFRGGKEEDAVELDFSSPTNQDDTLTTPKTPTIDSSRLRYVR